MPMPRKTDGIATKAEFDEEQQDYLETVRAVQEAYEDVKVGRTRPAAEFLEDLRLKHGLPH
jgi:hypothetical protein